MNKHLLNQGIIVVFISVVFSACKDLAVTDKQPDTAVPASYNHSQDTTTSADLNWHEYFQDQYLIALIDTALAHNQELNIMLQEISVEQNEIMAKKGEYLPSVGLKAASEVEKVGRYTSQGANDANTDIDLGKEMPEPLPDQLLAAYATWEVDIWKKLRNAKKSQVNRYLASIEGRNFMVTHLIAEIANSYYELLALDNELAIVKRNIEIQANALKIVKLQKESTRVTELAVRKFEAEVYNTRSLQFDIQQQIIETENRINFLLGRFPQPITRTQQELTEMVTYTINEGIPSQLLENRPDVKQAEYELEAAKLDVKVAKANFYPSLGISAGIGLQAFNPTYLVKAPESMIYSIAGDLTAPLINRKAIKATYYSANAKQIQAAYNYERTILNAYIEVANQLAKIQNLQQSYELRAKQVEALTESIKISTDLFQSARADYMEVLMTQRDALESKFELVETKMHQMNTMVNIYQALGGGWKE